MGQMARMSRAARFIDEFGADYVNRHTVKAGDKLTVATVGLGYGAGDEERVSVGYSLRRVDGQDVGEVSGGSAVFDPEYSTQSDVVERLTEDLGISEEEARARLAKAELFH